MIINFLNLLTNEAIPFSGSSPGINCLPEQFIYYFLELYSFELQQEKNVDENFEHNGCIILDTPKKHNCSDQQTHYKGFEFRIYNAHIYVKLEAVYCLNNNKFYLNNITNDFKMNMKTNDFGEIENISNEKQKCNAKILCEKQKCNAEILYKNYIYFYNLKKWRNFLEAYVSFYLFISTQFINTQFKDEIQKNYNYLCPILDYYCKFREKINGQYNAQNNKESKSLLSVKYIKYKKKYLLLKKSLLPQ